MGSKKKNFKPIIKGEISQDTYVFIKDELSTFVYSDEKEKIFPTWLTNGERAWVHDSARKMGLKTHSVGKDENRFVTVYKDESAMPKEFQRIPLDIKPIANITAKLEALSVLDFKDSATTTETKSNKSNHDSKNWSESGLAKRKALVPPFTERATELWMDHPIHEFKYGILQSIEEHSVTIITGETGCGKTTQVPQYILEEATERNRKVKIICSLPRRVATISVSERVANERRQSVGATVGYQIRHESRVSSNTCLTFCTTGVVLRALLIGDAVLQTCTHIIIDEIHERDSLSDFTLIALRERLPAYPNLKIILMSATLDVEKLVNYFEEKPFFQGKVGLLAVPGALHHVQITHLETILIKFEADEKAKKIEALENEFISEGDSSQDSEYFEFVDRIVESALSQGSPDIFEQLQQFIFGGHIPVNYQTRDRKITPLMVAAKHGQLNLVQLLFGLGATDRGVRDKFNNNASFYAEQSRHPQMIELFRERRLASGRAQFVKPITEEDIINARGENLNDDEPRMSERERMLVDLYMQKQNRGRHMESQFIDYEFIIKILENLQQFYSEEGAILIFLPGYEEIMTLKRLIENDEDKLAGDKTIVVYTLHSRMKTGDQKQVFQPSPANKRKVILATNIAETSITINDVSIVIDTGKVKEQTYDILSGAHILGTTWISKACARQRAGRAGRTRPGICLRLYTSEHHQLFQEFHIPEMLRIPLQELCLQTKLLAPSEESVADFLSKALDPPQVLAVERAINSLKLADALDQQENLTALGRRLVNLPVLPHLGKMLVTAILLKCLDPVLTIVSCLSAGDIFKLPSQPALLMQAAEARMELFDNSMSDHFLLLRIFEEFVNAERQKRGFAFCDKLCLSYINMQQVVKIRNQIFASLQELVVSVSSDPSKVDENSRCWPLIKAALTAGLYPNIARANRKVNSISTAKEPKVNLHSSCCFKKLEASDGKALPPWILFEELHRGLHSMFGSIRTCTMVSPVTVFLFAGPSELPEDCVENALEDEYEATTIMDYAKVNIDQYINFIMKSKTAEYLLLLRSLWSAAFKKKLDNPKEQKTQDDLEKVLSSMKELIVDVENNLFKHQPFFFSQDNRNWRNNNSRERNYRPRPQEEPGSWRRQNGNQQQNQGVWRRGGTMAQNQRYPQRNPQGPGPMSMSGDEAYSQNLPRFYQAPDEYQWWGTENHHPQSTFRQGRQFSNFEMENWREEKHRLHPGEQPRPNMRLDPRSGGQGHSRYKPLRRNNWGPSNDMVQPDSEVIGRLSQNEHRFVSYHANRWK